MVRFFFVGYRRYASDMKREGRMDGQCNYYYASKSSFDGIKIS